MFAVSAVYSTGRQPREFINNCHYLLKLLFVPVANPEGSTTEQERFLTVHLFF